MDNSDIQARLIVRDIESSSPARIKEIAEWLQRQAELLLSGECANKYTARFHYSSK